MTNTPCPANKRLEPGLSGTWVTRGSDLLGVIVAVYENEPYAHMLPIRQVFSDIQSLLAQDEKFPEVGILFESPLIGRKSTDMISEIRLPRDTIEVSLEPSFHTNNQRHIGIDTGSQEVIAKKGQKQTSVGPEEPKQAPAEQNASRNNHQFPTLPIVLNEQNVLTRPRLAAIITGVCLTSFVLGLVSGGSLTISFRCLTAFRILLCFPRSCQSLLTNLTR